MSLLPCRFLSYTFSYLAKACCAYAPTPLHISKRRIAKHLAFKTAHYDLQVKFAKGSRHFSAPQSPCHPRRWIDEEAPESNYQHFTDSEMAKAMRQLERAKRKKSGMEPAGQKSTIKRLQADLEFWPRELGA